MRCDITIPRPAPAVRHLQYSRRFGRDGLRQPWRVFVPVLSLGWKAVEGSLSRAFWLTRNPVHFGIRFLAQAAIQLCIGFVPHPKVSRQSAEDADVSEALRTTSAVCPLLHFERTPRLLQSLQRIRRFLRHRLLLL